MTARVDGERLERFYELVRTPVETGEGPPPAPCTVPDHVTVLPARKLVPVKDLELLVPRPSAVIGFLVSWGIVALMIGVFVVLVR